MSILLLMDDGPPFPRSLFASGEQGIWLDPSDFSTLFQDAAGTTPVTAVGQPVGKILDKSGRGNHATQSTGASRPTVEARVNLLTYSEQMGNAAWPKTRTTVTSGVIAGPFGAPADKISEDTSTNTHYITHPVTLPSGVLFTASIYLKAAGRTRATWSMTDNVTGPAEANINLATGTVTLTGYGSWTGTSASIADVGDGWYRVTVSGVKGAGTVINSILLFADNSWENYNYTGDGVSGMYATAAQLEYGPVSTYQKVNTATDYVDVGAPRYLSFDGTDDGMATPSINFTGTDKMTVWAGVRKLSDAATGTVVELSASKNINNGVFALFAPIAPASPDFSWHSKGTTERFAISASDPAPITTVATCLADIGADIARLRLGGGAKVAESLLDQGTGNYGNYPLYIGRRGGTSLPFNGRIYQLIIRGAASNDGQIAAGEAWCNSKTRAY